MEFGLERHRRLMKYHRMAILLFLGMLVGELTATAQSCESLTSLRLPDTSIRSAQVVGAGGFRIPADWLALQPPAVQARRYNDLPAFCRVAATLKPSSDSDIEIEVWLPVLDWNRKFLAVGNGGLAGSISYVAMADALKRGYATSGTDTGHKGQSTDGSFALGHPEKVIDFGYRSVHEMTVKAKALIAEFYGNGPRWSYWNGCSQGG